MQALQRHQLAWLTDAGWQHLLAGAWDAQARGCLAHWAQQRLPLVVTRQRAQAQFLQADAAVCLGLPAPGRWDRRRIALAVPCSGIAHRGVFPAAQALTRLLSTPHCGRWRTLCEALSASGTTARVHGSFGWQLLTGLDHLRPGSDIDLCACVQGPDHADAVAALLQGWPEEAPRLDGELVFEDGSAVAWREWLAWRAGRSAAVLVKRLDGAHLAHAPFRPVEAAA